jgi:hypothetical protein
MPGGPSDREDDAGKPPAFTRGSNRFRLLTQRCIIFPPSPNPKLNVPLCAPLAWNVSFITVMLCDAFR